MKRPTRRIIWSVNELCNLNCAYCYKTKKNNYNKRIDIEKLLSYIESTGEIFHISFTGGGEPLLVPNIIEACKALAEKGHEISFSTNLITPKVS